ncbi:hypothetical protein PM082_016934 [Marasmius tenuissimus]|nr:hypothetical protein PM082_016934 [Marasmius tenuissimus]
MFNHSNSPRISVSGGTLSFNVVHGNQFGSHTQSSQDRHHFPPGEEWKEELYREYERMSTGRIKLINTISETGVERRTYEESQSMSWLEGSDTSRAKRVLHLACAVRGTRESPPFLIAKYTGRDAKRAFKMDIMRFSQFKDPVFPQLHGFNDSEIPMAIFHDLLVPANHVIEHAQNSPALLCYLRLQGETAASNLSPTIASIISSAPYSHNEHIWIKPQTGDVCLGPAGPWIDLRFPIWIHSASPHNPHLGRSPLPLSAYNNPALFDYLVQNATNELVVYALSQQYTWPYYHDEINYDQHILHVRRRFHGQPVAKFPESTWTFTFHCFSRFPDDLEELTETLMEDGRIRLTIWNHEIEHRSLNFHFFQDRKPWYSYSAAWLCQAVHVFHILGIPREEWEDFALLPDYSMLLSLRPFGHAQSHRNFDHRFDPPYYLFVLPPPQLPDTTPDVVSWNRAPAGSLYYWSVDPDGNSRMSEAHHMALGLPCFRNSADLFQVSWKAEIYDLVRQWQEAKGFDPTTTDFARSMGHPIVEILPQDDNRFDTFVDNGESTEPNHEQGPEPMEVDEAFESIPDPQGSSFPPQFLGASASTDVDMEDCSNRMASLCVEAMSMGYGTTENR